MNINYFIGNFINILTFMRRKRVYIIDTFKVQENDYISLIPSKLIRSKKRYLTMSVPFVSYI